MIYCKCGGVFHQSSRCNVTEDGVIQRHYYKCSKCGMKKKVTELEIKLYAVRKELKNCYENCFGAVGDHADTGA